MKILKDQNGNILILGVFLILIISMLFAGMVEFGRIMLVREQLQTAADSAALAGAGSGTHRFVKINVITDRGEYVSCDGDDEECDPVCYSCGTVTIRGIVGNESDLIDKGEWRSFCVPMCDCGGGDCYFELVDRQLMYDTHSMGWGANPQEIDNAEQELTEATREILAQSLYGYTSTVKQMVRGMSLHNIQLLLDNRERWLSGWMVAKGYNSNCSGISRHDKKYSECIAWKNAGYQQYSKAFAKKPTIENLIQTLENMRGVNRRPVQKIDAQYAEASSHFFKANLPKNAADAGITKLKVYGYENRNSPYYPSVVVYATAKIRTIFPQWFNNDFTTTVCAQGTTAYRDPDDQTRTGNQFYNSLKFGKWRKLPDKACWVDW
jgi:hypothetical protein